MVKNNFVMGRTIVGARGKDRMVELERIARRKRLWWRNVLIFLGCGIVGILVVVFLIVTVMRMMGEREEVAVDESNWVPSVEIISEGGGMVSERVAEFVAKLERDFGDLGLGVERVVLPLGMSREVDVFLVGRTEYYKMSIDRGSAVLAEDAERMGRFLDERGIVATYVELRVEGKAYYK